MNFHSPDQINWARKKARWLMKPWHLFRAWSFARRIRRQRRGLAKFVRQSAYEINSWMEEIQFLDEQLEYHLGRAGNATAHREEEQPAEHRNATDASHAPATGFPTQSSVAVH